MCAVDADGLEVGDLAVSSELVDAVDDASAHAYVVGVDGLDAVGSCDVDGSADGVHEVGLAVCGEFDDLRSPSYDGDGLVVSEACDVESHDRLVVVSVLELAVDRLLDEFEGYEGVVGCVGELSEDAHLVCRGCFAVLGEDVVGPYAGSEAGDVAEIVGFEVVLDVGCVVCRDVDGLPVSAVLVECVVEGSGEACGVSDHEHLCVAGGHGADDGVEDELSDAGCFVDDEEDVFAVEALEIARRSWLRSRMRIVCWRVRAALR